MRNEAKGQQQHGNTEPDTPSPAPDVVIGQGTADTSSHPDDQPHRLSLDEVVDVPMAILSERTGTEEHHHPKGDKSHNR